jgi:hypothetical protein
MRFGSRMKQIKHAWNAFLNLDFQNEPAPFEGSMTFGSSRPDRTRLNVFNERSIISSIYNRLGIDVAANQIKHVRTDADNRYLEDIMSGLNDCLTVEANIDQAARAFRQDIAMTLFDCGVAAIVPVDTSYDPTKSASFDIKTLRVGEIVAWMPQHVRVNLYNDQTGRREEVTLMKRFVAIVENPLYSVMNETNSTLQRLIRKLSLLDGADEATSSGKLDLIIQLPYVIKSETRRQQANQRAKDLEFQLKSSKYGIGYTDGTEKITQLNRPVENNLLKQIEYLTAMLYSQLGLTVEVMNGTADEAAMINYYNRTIEPILAAIVEAMKRSFLTKTARSQYQSIMSFRDPFKLVPVAQMADIADKFTRNEVLSSNEVRQFMGIAPSKDPKADMLRNSNMPQPGDVPGTVPTDPNSVVPAVTDTVTTSDSAMQDAFASVDQTISDIFDELGINEDALP